MKLNADTEVNNSFVYFIHEASSTAASPNPPTTPNVDTTTSFATSPLIVATVEAQFPNPKGLNIGAIIYPIASRIEWLSSENSTNSNFVDIFCRNHITTVASNIIVPAFIINAFTLSHTVLIMFDGNGR